jgi:hypothetical protein
MRCSLLIADGNNQRSGRALTAQLEQGVAYGPRRRKTATAHTRCLWQDEPLPRISGLGGIMKREEAKAVDKSVDKCYSDLL